MTERPFVPRLIQTVYYLNQEIVKVNSAVHANSAVLRCVDHLQLNDYGATHAEVFDADSGVLHAVIVRDIPGEIYIIFKREVQRGM